MGSATEQSTALVIAGGGGGGGGRHEGGGGFTGGAGGGISGAAGAGGGAGGTQTSGFQPLQGQSAPSHGGGGGGGFYGGGAAGYASGGKYFSGGGGSGFVCRSSAGEVNVGGTSVVVEGTPTTTPGTGSAGGRGYLTQDAEDGSAGSVILAPTGTGGATQSYTSPSAYTYSLTA